MRLIQFTASNGWRGHEQKIIYLYEAFKAEGYVEDQWIVCPIDSELYRIATDKGMQVIPFEYKSEYSLSYAKAFKKLAKEKKASVVFIHSSKAHTLAVLSHFIYGMKVPLVLCRTLIKRVDTNFFRKWKYNYKGIKKIICVSQPVVESLKFAVKDHSRFTVIGSVTDINKFQKQEATGLLHKEFNIPEDYKLIGNIAEFTGFKDHYTWVDTVAILVKENKFKAKYILVGKGSMEQDIRNYVEEKGLTEHIIFTGFRRDVPELLPELDLFLFTSNNEPTGGVLLESYACKVPIVAADAGGISEVVVNGETGLLAEVGNATDFAKKVNLLISDEELQEKFTRNGYQYLLDHFTKSVIAKKMFDELAKHELKH
ncbi:glycosyltransferase family 4 protein [Winogradskyella arenosi]|uniref:Glycosyltransferase involved in cell wall biosynthesis n=1 Tax=Winogradskyella arenosi TaxID=533325 RepID=A0A368ZFJ2_9FLAO|nr:glycosyltransferase family 4 protein [Winogradskyella arenosi]RCW92213.1 glycosyltransferase involved in cell wall biosynthesis [Winogradskyella arenosi]